MKIYIGALRKAILCTTLVLFHVVNAAWAQIDVMVLATQTAEGDSETRKNPNSANSVFKQERYSHQKPLSRTQKHRKPQSQIESSGLQLPTPPAPVDIELKNEPIKTEPEVLDVDKSQEDSETLSRARDVVLGGSLEEVQRYRSLLLDDDSRRNLIDLSLAPTYIYNHSSSTSWYRNYHSSSPGLTLGALAWPTPFFGVRVSYRFTLGGSISADPGTSAESSSFDHWLSVGVRFRRFFSGGSRPSNFVLGVEYSDYSKRLGPDERNRVNIGSRGVKILFETQIASGHRYSHSLGVELMPYFKHLESSTALNLNSGTGVESHAVGASLGGTIHLTRLNGMYWKGSHFMEKHVYTGVSNQRDPVTGTVPNGVSVINSFSSFELGYIWSF